MQKLLSLILIVALASSASAGYYGGIMPYGGFGGIGMGYGMGLGGLGFGGLGFGGMGYGGLGMGMYSPYMLGGFGRFGYGKMGYY